MSILYIIIYTQIFKLINNQILFSIYINYNMECYLITKIIIKYNLQSYPNALSFMSTVT